MADSAEVDMHVLWTEGDIVMSRGRFGMPSRPVLTVAPCVTTPDAAMAGRFEHAYGLRHALDPAWAAVPVAYLDLNQRPTLVAADPGGQLLATLLADEWHTERFLRMAIALARAVGQMHAAGLVHRDIKPSHLVVDEARGQAWLTGFSIAASATESSRMPPPGVISGTYAYMAPEQTGRMNRPIDTRSDLYGLGVTLYEVLAGTLPFVAEEPSEWIHCHMARLALPPEEELGRAATVLSKIVLALLAKDPEDRYQSAAALEADLRRCLADWITGGEILSFTLGQGARGGHLVAPQKLYGRDAEVGRLRLALARARDQGCTELVLVAGYSGSGKSALVAELQRQGLPATLSASGKFDQSKRDIPYSTLAQICDALVAHVLALPAAALDQWRDDLRLALGDNAAQMVNLAPSFALLMGIAADAGASAAPDAQVDVYLLFRRFLQVFASSDCPLVLFLDDVQWIDAATLRFLESMVIGNDVRHVLLIAAYRDNEVGAGHPLQSSLDLMRAAEVRVETLVMQPLTVHELDCLVSDALHCTRPQAQQLAQLLKSKTDGNPFFVIQFLNTLIDEGLLTFDAARPAWNWDVTRIEAQGLTDNVVELMEARLRRLSPTSQRALGRFACLGHFASTRTMALALHLSVGEIDIALWEAVNAGLIQRVDDGYAFLHDRVQEAAYEINRDESGPAIHLDIGRELLAHYAPGERDEHIFEIANQLNRGLHLVDTAAERLDCARVNLAAGERARRSTAHAAALTYFRCGCSLADAALWEHDFQLGFDLQLRLGEAEFLTGDLGKAEATLAALALRASSVVDGAAVAWMQITLLTAAGQLDRAIDICLDYLRRVDVDWAAAPTRAEVWEEYAPLGERIRAGQVETILALPDLLDAEKKATMDVLVAALPPAFFTNQNLVCLLLCRIANMSIRWGQCDASALGYAYLGMMLGPYFGEYDAGYRFGQLGYDLVETGRFERFKARVYMCFAYHVMPWTKHIRTGVPLLRLAFKEAVEAGDLTYTGFSSCTLITSLLASGEHLREVQAQAEAKLEFIRKTKFDLVANIIATQVQLIRALRGLTGSVGRFDDSGFSEQAFEAALPRDSSLTIARCWYWIRKLQAHYFAGDYPAAVRAAELAQPLLWTTGGHFEFAEFHFYAALARAQCAGAATPALRPQHDEALAAHAAQLALWADSGPANFSCRASLVGAERARLAGDYFAALQLYESAIAAAQHERFKYVEALANELAAGLCLAHGLPAQATSYLKNAQMAYRAWGAEGKVRQLNALHPQLSQEKAAAPQTVTIGARLDALDLATVVKTAEAISGQIGLDRLISTLMSIVLEHSGADRAVLILPRENELWVEGEASAAREVMDIRRPHIPLATFDVPASMIHQVIRDRTGIVVDNAQTANPFGDDVYFSQTVCRSVFCFPLLKQAKVIGLLYLENNLAPHVFTAARQAVLNLLASQAAVSLENATLEENGALLKEVHHRVKNNLQLISSLLSLQAGRIADPQVAELFHESRNRVRAMAMVHENLYRAGNFARVPMADHVTNLCRQIARAYGLNTDRIALTTHVDEMQLDLNRAVSCGLLINELITNALKHAFPHDAAGEMRVEMRLQRDKMCVLTVSDNGSGMLPRPEGADSGSLGLQLIEDLTAQLQGSMAVHTGEGTLVSITFPIDGQGD
jgi:predicted ATPase/two-component sensor histidine kinase